MAAAELATAGLNSAHWILHAVNTPLPFLLLFQYNPWQMRFQQYRPINFLIRGNLSNSLLLLFFLKHCRNLKKYVNNISVDMIDVTVILSVKRCQASQLGDSYKDLIGGQMRHFRDYKIKDQKL